MSPTRALSLRARLIFYSVPNQSGCWVWLAARDRDGYGSLQARGRKRLAHRLSYETFRGEIPEGLVLDHLCRNRWCINPAHLEAVTNEENVNRGLRSGISERCVNNHPFTVENTGPRADSGRRRCRACNAEAQRRRTARRKEMDQ